MAVLLLASSCLAQANGGVAQVGLKDILASVVRNNLSLKALEHKHRAAVLDVKADNAIGAPSVEYSPFYRKGYSGLAESELIVSEEIEFPTKYAARNKQARLLEGVNESEYMAAQRDVLLQAETLCYDLIRSKLALEVLQQRLDNALETKALVEKRLAAGDATALELNKTKLECMEIQTLVAAAKNERNALLQSLSQLNGGEMIDCSDSVFPASEVLPDLETLKISALNNSPDVKLAEANLKASTHDVAMSQGAWLPNITLGYRRNTDLMESSNGVLLGLSIPVFGNGSRVKAAKDRKRSAEYELQMAHSDAEKSLSACYTELKSMQALLETYDMNTLKESVSLLDKAMKHGQMSILEYYTEVDAVYNTMLTCITTQCDCAKLQARLRRYTSLPDVSK